MAEKKLNPDAGNFPVPVNPVRRLLAFDETAGKLGFVDDAVEIAADGTMEILKPVLRNKEFGIVASTTQTQGNGQLTAEINEISTVANPGDVVTLPPLPSSSTGSLQIIIINGGANDLQMFPASGDDLGSGVDISEFLEPNEVVTYVGYNGTNWRRASSTEIPHAEIHAEDSVTVFVINDAGGDFHSYHSADLSAGDLSGWTFDAGGNGVSFPIASIADSAGSPGSQILVTTTGSHGLAVGDVISHTNLADAAYVGMFQVAETAAATTYEVAAVFTATDTGTMDQAATLTLNVGIAASYQLHYHASAVPDSNNETYDFQLFINSVVAVGSKTRRRFSSSADFGALSGGAIADVASGDKVSFAIRNQDSASDITIRNFTLIVSRL